MKARFWTFARNGSPVRLTLRPGQILRHSSRWHNGEGWSWEHDEYENDPDAGGIINRWARGGRDCDGSSSTSGELFAPYAELSVCLMYERPGLLQPAWTKYAPDRAYDQYAELANY